MANYVKISTVSPNPIRVADTIKPDKLLEIMIENWAGHIDKVLPDSPDLIVLPEACDRPFFFPMEPRLEFYRYRGDKIRDFLASIAAKNNCYIAYSAAREKEDGTFRNSTEIIDRQGKTAGIYNKNHLVPAEKEDAGILYGKEAPIIKCDFGTIGCVICFDLNFEELRLKYAAAQPDLLVFSSMYHGGLMQAYWAYSCRSHFVASIANTSTPSEIRQPTGEVIASTTNYFSYVTARVNLDSKLVHLDGNFEKIDAAKHKYGSKFQMVDPSRLGAVLISSESDEFTINDIINEFEIETLDEYMNRVMEHRHTPGNIEP